jgi:hypothetical protein
MRKFIVFAALLCGCAATLTAQGRKDKLEVFGGYSYTRVYGDVNFPGAASSSDNEFQPYSVNGGRIAISYFPIKHFGVTYSTTFTWTGEREEADDGIFQSTKTQEFAIGPVFRYSLKKSGRYKVSFFAHQLFGVTRGTYTFKEIVTEEDESTSYEAVHKTNNVTSVSGGGLDVRIRAHVAIRPILVEYVMRQTPFNDLFATDSGESWRLGISNLRYSTGAKIYF